MGSIPAIPQYGVVAHMVERSLSMREVGGSIPSDSKHGFVGGEEGGGKKKKRYKGREGRGKTGETDRGGDKGGRTGETRGKEGEKQQQTNTSQGEASNGRSKPAQRSVFTDQGRKSVNPNTQPYMHPIHDNIVQAGMETR